MNFVKIFDKEYIELVQWQALRNNIPYKADDDIECDCYDSQGVLRYTFDLATDPSIIFDESTSTFSIKMIEVTNFPDGDVVLKWKAYIDGVQCKQGTEFPWVQTIPFSRVAAEHIDELDIFNKRIEVYKGQQFSFYPLIVKDQSANLFNPNDIRLSIFDSSNVLVTTLAGINVNTGVYRFNWNCPANQSTGYYTFIVECKPVSGDDWQQISMPQTFSLMNGPTYVYVDKRSLASDQDCIEAFYRIYDFIPEDCSTAIKKQIINRACQSAHKEMLSHLGPHASNINITSLRQAEAKLAVSYIIKASQGLRKGDWRLAEEFRNEAFQMLDPIKRAYGWYNIGIEMSW